MQSIRFLLLKFLVERPVISVPSLSSSAPAENTDVEQTQSEKFLQNINILKIESVQFEDDMTEPLS